MAWLKKNLFLAVGGLILLGLLGFAIFFLINSKAVVDEVTGQLAEQTEQLKKLATRDPYPDQKNIESAREEQKKVGAFLQDTRKFFVPVATFTNMDSATFKNLLETTISEMVHDADKAGVTLPNAPAKYDFTFKPQRSSVDFVQENLVPLASQVAEIEAICDVLFDARIQTLVSLRRTPVAKEDEGAADYLFGRKPITNAVTGAVLMPYEIAFQGFSSELAAVLEGFYRSSNCLIVKNIDVQTNIVQIATPAETPSYLPYSYRMPFPGPEPPQPSAQDLMLRRYGLRGPGSRYSHGPPPPIAPTPTPGVFAPPARKGPETILDERPFKVTMYIEAVRLTERTVAKPAARLAK